MAFDDPVTLALLGASSGFLDPRGGMMGGFHGALQGLQAGNEIKRKDLLAQQQQQKLTRDMESRQLLQDTLAKQQQAGDMHPVSIANALISTGHPELANQGFGLLKDFRSKVKTTNKVLKDGQEFTQPIFDDGTFGEVNSMPNPVRPMQVNQGSQVSFIDPNSLQQRGAVGVGMSPGDGARLAQGERHHQANYAIDIIKAQNAIREAQKPQFKDGAFIYNPTEDNPQGRIVPTDLYTAPKGSQAEKDKMSSRVKDTLGTDTEQLINKATGSVLGAGVDMGASVLGGTTSGAEANATLKLRAATLAGNVPRFEGPQSDADRKYYLEMAGDLANPMKTTKEKLVALKELRRIHNLPDPNGVSQTKNTGGASGSFDDGSGYSVRRLD